MADTNATSEAKSKPEFPFTDEVIALVRQAMTWPDDTPMPPAGQGLFGYELEAPAKCIVPHDTPLHNMLPRVVRKETEGESQPETVSYTSILGYDVTPLHTGAGGLTFASSVSYNTVKLSDQLQTLSVQHPVNVKDEGDAHARAVTMALYHLIQQEERFLFARIVAQARSAKEQRLIRTVQTAQPGMSMEPQLQSLLHDAYADAAADPDFFFMAPATHQRLSAEIANGHGLHEAAEAPTSPPLGTGALVPQYRLTHLINSATDKEIPVVTSPLYPEDVVLALTLSMPFPTPDTTIGADVEVFGRDYWGVTVRANAAAPEIACALVEETPRVRFIGGLCLLEGISA